LYTLVHESKVVIIIRRNVDNQVIQSQTENSAKAINGSILYFQFEKTKKTCNELDPICSLNNSE